MDENTPIVIDKDELIEKNKHTIIRAEHGKFQKGYSANPNGRPKKSVSEKELMERIKALGDLAVGAAKEMLESKKIAAPAKAQVISLILAYCVGKPESSVKVTTQQLTPEESKARIDDLVSRIKVKEA